VLTEYIPGTSVLHRLDVRTKTVWLLVLIVLAFMFDHPAFGVVLLCGVLLLFPISTVPFAGVKRMLLMLLPVLVVMVGVTAFSHLPEEFRTPEARKILFYLFPHETAPLTWGGVLLGATFLCRIVIMVLASMLFTYTTPVEDLLQFSQILRLPYSAAFVLTTAIRFIPALEGKAGMVMDAQRSRGVDFGSGSFVKRIRSYGSIMIPMIVDSIRMSENLAVALMSRGFGGTTRSTVATEIRMKVIDYVFVVTAVVLLIMALVLRINNVGRL